MSVRRRTDRLASAAFFNFNRRRSFMAMTLLDLTAPSVDENLALDEALLLTAEAGEGGEVLRFWEWPTPAVVLGAGGSIHIDVNSGACRDNGVSIHRRASGGGT